MFFITTYDNISAEMMSILINHHPNFMCHLEQQSTLLPTINSKSIREHMQTRGENVFIGNIKSFTILSFHLAKNRENIQEDINVVNVTMPVSLRVKLLLSSWLSSGLSEENLYQRLINELKQQEVLDLISQYCFELVYSKILTEIFGAIKENGLENSAYLVSNYAKIFYIALALCISMDEMDSLLAKQTIAFDKMLQNPEEFFHSLNILAGQHVNVESECKENIISLLNNFNKIITHADQFSFTEWQDKLIHHYVNKDFNNQLRLNAIRSSFLSLRCSINLLKDNTIDNRFEISKNQLFIKNSNIHYELISLQFPMQMRDKNLIVPKSVLKNINDANVRFLYDLSFEAVTFGPGNQEDWLTMHSMLEEAGVPPHKVYFVCSNYNVKKYYSNWADQYNIKYRFNVFGNHYWPLRRICELVKDKDFQKIRYQLIDVAKKTVEDNVYRPYYFMCLNLKTRLIRTALLLFLLQGNYFSKGLITYLGRYTLFPSEKKISQQKDDLYFTRSEVGDFFNQLPNGKSLLQYYDQLDQMTPIIYDVKADETFDENWPLKQLIPELGKYGTVKQFESYFEIVTETYFLNEDVLNLTEKTIKPILRFQMFIIVGSPHTLSALRELGFQTFSPYIDETYDTITDPIERFICITKEIERLCNLSIDELHKLYCTVWPRILHNYNRLTQEANELLVGETNKLLEQLANYNHRPRPVV